MSELTASDVALMSNNNNGMNGMWSNPFVYLVWIWAFRMFGNGYGNDNAATQGALTRAELSDGLNFQSLESDVSAVRSAIADASSGISDKLCSGFNTTNSNILSGTSAIQSAVAQSGFAIQNGICDTNRNIDQIRYEMATNTCAITSAIHSEAEATRQALIDQQIQDLRDSRESVQRELQSAQLTLANAAQTQNILGSIGRYVPYAGCGSTCGCSGW